MSKKDEVLIYCSDIETTGLLHQLEEQGDTGKMHNFCAMSIEGERMYMLHATTKEDKESIQRFLNRDIILIMHNGICYDQYALKHFGYNTDRVTFVDTLALSWYLDTYRPKHGLESYGIECGVPKPVVDDWENLTQRDYDRRVKEDVKIQLYTYKKLKARFEELYGKMTDLQFCNHRVVRYLSFKMQQLAEQQNTRFKIDVPKALILLDELTVKLDDKVEQLRSVMPDVPKYRIHKKPAKPHKMDGSLSVTGERWRDLTESHGHPFDYNGEIKTVRTYETANPNSSAQIKAWLDSMGWKPQTFKYVKDGDGNERAIPQIYLPQSGGQICYSIEMLAEEMPDVLELTGMGVLQHRKGIVQSFLDSLIFGKYIEAGAAGFTNTLRLKHRKPFVNLPSSRVAYGEDVRSCLISREGKVVMGSDLSALENVIKFNLQLPHDRDYVISQQSEDFDPHLDIAVEAGMLSEDDMWFYKIVDGGFPEEDYIIGGYLKTLLAMDDDKKDIKIKEISKIRGGGKGANYSCLPMDTEVLTVSGFKHFKDLCVTDEILSYKDGSVVKDSIRNLHFYEDAEVLHFGDSKKTIRCTANHRWLVSGRDEVNLGFKELKDFDTETKIRVAAPYVGGDKLTRSEGEFFGWLLSDGSNKKHVCSIAQSKNKFYLDVERVLKDNALDYHKCPSNRLNGNHVYTYTIPQEQSREMFKRCGAVQGDEDFNWSEWVMSLSREALEGFVDAFYLGDGRVMGSKSYSIVQNSGSVFDSVQLAVYLIGDGRVKTEFNNGSDICGTIQKHKTVNISCQRKVVKDTTVEDVFCLTTGNSNFIIKQDGEIMITGNCQYGAAAPTVSRAAGVSLSIAKKLVNAYRDRNWSIDVIASEQKTKRTSHGTYQLNPFNGIWYHLKTSKDAFSTLVQGTGSYVFDMWLASQFRLREKPEYELGSYGIKLLAQAHDEQVSEIVKGYEEVADRLAKDAINEVNKVLKLEIPFSVDTQFGKNYSEIH